ncbi:fused MFS/spermidine synthase [Corynebacterium felinum]|uniref:Spermidine synthase n=1 Tax=Corynebacterium felinum TaxID=131318 RepID=A0ABU2B9R0_9CORY|nr:fused MFS/spermidine synthase [Corynebacterium felinum]MDF5821839.1 fused MFS/spermidine synthase [Corynebacterium felinum]MDR7355351.1 spermidine synthase [Corynebacterium felinum]WJY94703.1 spermidine synthase [Corynebacterium felinum]
MGRKRETIAGTYQTSTGEVEVRVDPHGGYEIFVNHVPSSHISDDPLRLEYEYMRWIVALCPLIEQRFDVDKLRVTHLGGGACSLPRYFVAKYPRSRNSVVELDSELTQLVRQWFQLPAAPQLKIRAGEARAVADTFVPQSRDVVIRDVFAQAVTPDNLCELAFYRQIHASLSDGGLYIANCGDHKDLKGAKAELRGMAEVFAHLAVIADPSMLKGRRYGNIILVGSDKPVPVLPEITRELLQGGVPAQMKNDEWVRAFMVG